MAELTKGVGLPLPPAAMSAAGLPGAVRGAPPSPAGGGVAAAARIFSAPDFAADLARLVALLGSGADDAASALGTPSPVDAETDGAIPLPVAGDPVQALCAEVALAQPVTMPPAEPVPADPDAPTGGTDGRAPVRTLQVTLTPPGAAVSAEHRAAQAPDDRIPPTLPLLPAAAAGATAFTLAPAATAEADLSVAPPTARPGDAPVPLSAALPVDTAPRAAPAVAATVVEVLHPQAPRQVAETVAWHVPVQGEAEVQIRLNPEELGPLEVQLKLDGDKVSVRFDLADERVRDVVQSSLPSLSSMLSARGLQLDQAQVFAQQRGHGSPHPHHTPQTPEGGQRGGDGSDGELSVSAATRPLIRRGLLDDYA